VTRNANTVTCHGAPVAACLARKAFHPLADMLPLAQGAEFERPV
jgi:hypothetical protein